TRQLGVVVPLADAFEVWGLDEREQLLLAAGFGAELSPRLSRLLAYLGGDATRPGLSVEAAAEVAAPGGGGAFALVELLDREGSLLRLALVSLGGGAEQPLLRRTVQLAPRLLPLARGRVALDPALEGARL